MQEQWIQITSEDGFVTEMWVVRPEQEAKAAVLVAMEIFGVNSHIQDVCRRLAGEGYLAMAPQLFDRAEKGISMGYMPEDIQRGIALKQTIESGFKTEIMGDIQACVDWAYDHENVNKVGMMGFCWGGLNTWRAAQQVKGVWAAICYYGGGMVAEAELDTKPVAPVLAHFSDDDASTPMAGIEILRERYADEAVVYVYPAAHGFNCDQRGAYNEGAAEVAWQRSLAFLRMCLA